jgi:hypothetical protein
LKKALLSCALLTFIFSSASALEVGLSPYAAIGTGQASGSLFDGIGERYVELGSTSATAIGAYGFYFPLILGGGGIDVSLSNGSFFLWKGPLAFFMGLDLGSRGGAVYGSTSAGTAFASASATSLALSLKLGERYRQPLGPGFLSAELSPLVGLNFAYDLRERISGTSSSVAFTPNLKDLLFVGAGLGLDYGIRLGPGLLFVGLSGDVGLTPLAAENGILGASIVYPWRTLLRAGYEISFGPKKGKK